MAPSPIFDHSQTTGQSIKLDNLSIVDRESQGLTRIIMEAMHIWVNDTPLNKNLGKFHLPHIWDGVLQHADTLFAVISPTYTSHSPHGPPLTKGRTQQLCFG